MKMLALAISCMLGGCASSPTTKVVEVPVAVSCVIEPLQRPPLVSDADLSAMTDYQLPLALFRDRKQREDYMTGLEAVLQGCTK